MTPPPDQPAPQNSPEAPHAPEPVFASVREESQFKENGAAIVHHEEDFREAELSSDLDVTEAHARGQTSANAGFVAVPTWVLVASVGVTLWAGFYMGNYSGGLKGDIFNEQPGMKGGGPPPPIDIPKLGEKLFNANCAQCHQQTGLGQAGQFPPLVGSEWVLENPHRLSHILVRGIQGPIKVKGATYNNQMPAWSTLKDEQISAILTYIRQAWGNAAPPITKEQVAVARKEAEPHTEAYTEAELMKIAPKEEAGAPQKQAAGPAPGTTQLTAPAAGNPPPDPAKKGQ